MGNGLLPDTSSSDVFTSSENLWTRPLPAEGSQEKHVPARKHKPRKSWRGCILRSLLVQLQLKADWSSEADEIIQDHVQSGSEYLQGWKCHLHDDKFYLPAFCVFLLCMPKKSLGLASPSPPVQLDKTDSVLPAAHSVKANRSLPQHRGGKAPAKTERRPLTCALACRDVRNINVSAQT